MTKRPKTNQIIKVLLLILVLALAANNSYAAEATLSWDAPTTNSDGTPLTDLAGYKIYQGTQSGTYDQNIDAGNVTTYQLTNLIEGSTYYFAVTAYDDSGNESEYSSEISKSIPLNDTTPYNYFCDNDNDGYFNSSVNGTCTGTGCEPEGCQTTAGNDCNDNDAQANPGAEDSDCNGIDENCDGTADNSYVATNTTCGDGVCASTGQLTCSNGTVVNTCTAGNPTGNDNDCNGIDENCDGTADNNYVASETACGEGVCSSTGQLTCSNGSVVNTCSLPLECLPATSTVINSGDNWKYFKGYSQPSTDWNTVTFDDSLWLEGITGIGYGDSDDATVLSDMRNNYISVYTRKTFNIENSSLVTAISLNIDYDDGFVAYLNGNEVARANMPDGTPEHNTFATTREAGTVATFDLSSYISYLGNGNNVLAIEVHNTTIGSSDLTLLPELTIETTPGDTTPVDYFCDNDNDGYFNTSIDGSCTGTGCEPEECQTTAGNDCNDNNTLVNPESDDSDCNGIDENCDGTADNNYVATDTACGEGVCSSTGQLTCSNGSVVNTCTAGSPTGNDSDCNGIDENCDGTADNNYVASDTACGEGVCSSTGQLTCSNGSVVNTCTAGSPTGNDSDCNGIDENCDGTADNNYVASDTACGEGVCSSTGQLTCSNGSVVNTCTAGSPTGNDSDCNGIDENCDGTADNNYVASDTACGEGVCSSTGQLTCSNGSVVNTCTAGSPTGNDSDCNGIDENCDGTADNNYVASAVSCGTGECTSTGQISCQAGTEVNSCTPDTPAEFTELTCDGLDNDCDGIVDESCSPSIKIRKVLLNEDFSSGIPDTWSVSGSWNTENSCGKSIGDPLTAPFAIADSSCMETGVDELITEPFDTSSCSSVEVLYKNQYYWYSGNIEVSASDDGGTTWTASTTTYTDDGYPAANIKDLDISSATGDGEALAKFKYTNSEISGHWAIDDVIVACQSTNIALSSEISIPAHETIIITNTGTTSLTTGMINIEGTNSAEFSLVDNNCSNQTLLPDETCMFDVTFIPATAGAKNAAISIPSNDPEMAVFNIPLSGKGTLPDTATAPVVQIMANGKSGVINLKRGDSLNITVELDPGSYLNTDADMWILFEYRNRLYYYSKSSGKWRKGDSIFDQGPLSYIRPLEVLNSSHLNKGQYTFYFMFDTNMDGYTDSDLLYSSELLVNIN